MKNIIIATLIATAFISLLLSANMKQQEQKQQSVPITTTTYMTEKEKITTEPVTQLTTTTSITTTITSPVTTTQPISTETTTPKNGTIEGDLIWIQGFGWIEYEGVGCIGYYDAEMYTNGNKIGYFG